MRSLEPAGFAVAALVLIAVCSPRICEAASSSCQDPTQLHLALSYTHSDMTISWSTACSAGSDVLYGTTPGNLTMKASAMTPSATYTTNAVPRATTGGFVKYVSPYQHHVTVTGLMPSTQYYYKAGDASSGVMSAQFSFSTIGTEGSHEPITFDVVGDIGQTQYSQETMNHMAADTTARVVVHAGDMAYADCDGGRWDSYMQLMQPLGATRPWMVIAGNHEIEPDGTGKIMSALKYRYAMPQVRPGVDTSNYHQNASDSGYDCTPSAFTGGYDYGNSFYAVTVHTARLIFLNSYTGTDVDSNQYKWLQAELAGLDRSVTPWVFATWHSPWYNSNPHHQHEFNTINMRAAMEDLLVKAGVDAVFNGHVHAYERTTPVYMNKTDPAGPTYLVIGDGGNREGHDAYTTPAQPWSAFRDGDVYGHGRMHVFNATHALWEWHRNTAARGVLDSSAWSVGDSVWLHARKM